MSILIFFLILEEDISFFHHWVWFYLYVFSYGWSSLWWGNCCSILNFCSSLFIMKVFFNHECFQMLFLHLLRWLCDFYTLFYCTVHHIDLFSYVETSLIPGICIPIWPWCIILLIWYWIQFASILLRISASVFESNIGLLILFLAVFRTVRDKFLFFLS